MHFGPERDVVGDDLPSLLRAATDGDESIAEFLGNPVFKVLVLGTRSTDAFTGPLIAPPPFPEENSPAVINRGAGRELFRRDAPRRLLALLFFGRRTTTRPDRG